MRVLRIDIDGLPLFKKKLTVDFIARQRVAADESDKLYNVFGNCYQNNVISIVGVNASGKTSLLKAINFTFRMLNNEPINTIGCKEILGKLTDEQQVCFDVYFYVTKDSIEHLHTVIKEKENRYFIEEEIIESNLLKKIKTKKSLFDFTNAECIQKRDKNEEFLLDDVSIMVAYNKRVKQRLVIFDMLQYTNVNLLNIEEDFPAELLAFFDPNVEYLHIKKQKEGADIRLKFKGGEEIVLAQPMELNRYLSSGTIKGMNTFIDAMHAFEKGGYLIVDEVENHFNKEIVSTLIRFFMDRHINPNGAVMIFSTHYTELLDEFDRNDNIYIVRNHLGITAKNLSDILKRNDIKKSDAYQSGILEGTTPSYESYIDLKKVLLKQQEHNISSGEM